MPTSQKASVWRVVATQKGFYNQTFREYGEVFELLNYGDGTYPVAVKEVQVKDEQGKPKLDEYGDFVINEVPITDPKSKEPLHRDYAEDMGPRMMRRGPKKGESVHLGWMRRVPNNIPCGMYIDPANATDAQGRNVPLPEFWNPRIQLPPPVNWQAGAPPDPRRIHAPVLRVLEKPSEDEAA